jgi:hypothetical protein
MHNLQTASTDLLRVITGSAADLDCIVSFIETTQASPPVPDWPETQFTNITTATTTTILAAPNASSIRKIKAVSIVNTHASQSTTVRVIIERTGPVNWDCFNTITLQPGESLTFTEGTGWFYNKATISVPAGTTSLLTGGNLTLSTTDVYLTNSSLKLDGLGVPTVGRKYNWRFIVSKTAGTAAPVVTVRVGTAGSTADTGRGTFTWAVGTSATDMAEIELEMAFISVGAGTSAVLRGKANMTNNLATTGFQGATRIAALQPADSAGFDSTAASQLIGLSFNGGTVFAGLMEFMACYTEQL